MIEKLNLKILELLVDKQLSISGLTRELKAEGVDEHRLILTGYLRALRDLEILQEIEVPPSKIYAMPESFVDSQSTGLAVAGTSGVSENSENIYFLIRTQLLKIDLDLRIPVGVHVISKLFERPCFRKELKLVGITSKHLDQYCEKSGVVSEAFATHLKKYRSEVTRIEIPPDDPAYEIRENSEEISRFANEVLAGIIKHRIDLDGLVAKSKQTTLLP
ncbi:hypothetical protein MSMTP_2222 [Methanosarcina sp. MTP4]|uniref:hypothetical protein n=1 Tax=Methanosarcina sp. MTP4 TaxID=1434100 RepID=UPI0006161888|nr:hypothetical protein [Methanosarcina sp. MTP4]AKB25691.1 hypothetical protein MSMTP_2222 [Methanosarcina sp. MTP4]